LRILLAPSEASQQRLQPIRVHPARRERASTPSSGCRDPETLSRSGTPDRLVTGVRDDPDRSYERRRGKVGPGKGTIGGLPGPLLSGWMTGKARASAIAI